MHRFSHCPAGQQRNRDHRDRSIVQVGASATSGFLMAVNSSNLMRLFGSTIALRGEVAPVRAYLLELLADGVAGQLDPSPVLDLTVDLDGVPSGYAAMDQHTAMKVIVRP
jgi:threonine dehydrogenase-like Zn-dependent dehydrogenase